MSKKPTENEVFATQPRQLSPEEILKVSGGDKELPAIKHGSGQDNQTREGFS